MTNDFASLAQNGVVLITTWLLHSTLLLGSVWLIVLLLRPRSWALRERMWRCAAVLSFATVGIQISISGMQPMFTWSIADTVNTIVSTGDSDSDGIPDNGFLDLRAHEEDVGDTLPDRSVNNATTDDSGASARLPGQNLKAPSTFRPQIPLYQKTRGTFNKGRLLIEQNGPESRWGVQITPGLKEEPTAAIDSQPLATVSVPTDSEVDQQHLGQSNNAQLSHRTSLPAPDGSNHAIPINNNRTDSAKTISAETQAAFVILIGISLWTFTGILRMLLRFFRLANRLRSAEELTNGPVKRIADQLKRKYGIRRGIRILVTETCIEPAVVGVFRWTILLPLGIEQQLDKHQLRALLSHELAHFVRGDTKWLWIGRLLTNCLGWQPLHFVAVRRWRTASEFLCDNWALNHGVSPLTLAKCLTQVAEWRVDRPAPATGLAAGGSRSSLVARVERLTNHSRVTECWERRSFRIVFAVCLIGSVALTTYAAPRTAWNPDEPTNSVSQKTFDPTNGRSAGDASRFVVQTGDAKETDNIDGEIRSLVHDLEQAMKLLHESENVPEVSELVVRIRARLRRIRHSRRQKTTKVPMQNSNEHFQPIRQLETEAKT